MFFFPTFRRRLHCKVPETSVRKFKTKANNSAVDAECLIIIFLQVPS